MSLFVLEPEISADEVLRGLGEAFVVEPRDQARRRFTYLDTFDWRLQTAGLSLAVSPSGRGVRLLLLSDDGRSQEARAPQTPRFASDLPPGPFRESLESLSSIRRFLPRAHADWREELFALLNEDEKTVVRLLVRRGDASLPGKRQRAPVPVQLHLESLKGYEAEFRKAASLVRKAFGLRPQDRGDLGMILGALGRTPGDYSSTFRLDLDPELRSDEAARSIHRCLLAAILANQDGMIQDLDPEFLHDFRVAVRRTRSALAQVTGVFPDPVLRHFGEEFRWLGERTGPTRDMDVYLLKIPGYQKALPEGVRDQLDPLVRFLSKKKRKEHGQLLRSLGAKRYARLLDDWGAFLRSPAEPDPGLPNAGRPIRLVASERIWKVYRKVLKRGRRTDRKTSPETLHQLRIDCKKLRYLMTFFQSLYPPETLKPLIKELKNLQDTLGDFNDLYVQRAALLGFAGEMLATGAAPPATLMAMGQLMGQLETRQSVEGDAFRERFQRFAGEKNRRRFRSLFAGAEEGVPAVGPVTAPTEPEPPEATPGAPEGEEGP